MTRDDTNTLRQALAICLRERRNHQPGSVPRLGYDMACNVLEYLSGLTEQEPTEEEDR